MSYPAPPPPQSGYPMPYHPGQLDAQGRPGGGTAITAGVLSVIGALAGVFMLLVSIGAIDAVTRQELPGAISAYAYGLLFASIVMIVGLAAGGILLFVRKRIGQWLVLAGCAAALLGNAASILVGAQGISNQMYGDRDSLDALSGLVFLAAVQMIPALATLILDLVPPTTRFLKWHPGQGASYPGQPYPFPPGGYTAAGGYPVPGGTVNYDNYPGSGGYPQPPQQQWGQAPPRW